MNMFARFDENPLITLEDIKETKRYGRTDAHTDGRTHGQQRLRGGGGGGIIRNLSLGITFCQDRASLMMHKQ